MKPLLALGKLWLVAVISASIFLYLPVSFAEMSFNPTQWTYIGRAVFALFQVVIFIWLVREDQIKKLKELEDEVKTNTDVVNNWSERMKEQLDKLKPQN